VNIDHIKHGYYSIKALNPTGVVPLGPQPAAAGLMEAVARMERSAIRERPIPDYASLHPGYDSSVLSFTLNDIPAAPQQGHAIATMMLCFCSSSRSARSNILRACCSNSSWSERLLVPNAEASTAAIKSASVSGAGALVSDADDLAFRVFRLVRLKAKSPPARATWFPWRTKP
jgi:hypothetical protein